MEFDFLTLNEIIRILSREKQTCDQNDDCDSTEFSEPPEQQQVTTQQGTNRHYCLIIFNNPRWSQQLRRHRGHSAQHSSMVAEKEEQDLTLDERFTIRLRQLFDDYMQHTRRPSPIKYFIDFTDQHA